ncbi:uncharacterized protein LOC135104701 [Scylla paramamosain]|uniref:uncharacterized protein LOC135104701 n=1 Tax=Scylla paramamosain TaxID=85552 RepID=UPI003083910E
MGAPRVAATVLHISRSCSPLFPSRSCYSPPLAFLLPSFTLPPFYYSPLILLHRSCSYFSPLAPRFRAAVLRTHAIMTDCSSISTLRTSTQGEDSFHDAAGNPNTFVKPLRAAAELEGLAKYATGDVRRNEEARKTMGIYSSESEAAADSCDSNVSLVVQCSDQSAESSLLEAIERKEREEMYRVTTPHRRKEPPSKRRHVVKSPLRKTKTRKPREVSATTTKRRLAARLKLYAIMHNEGVGSREEGGPRPSAKRKRSSESEEEEYEETEEEYYKQEAGKGNH